MKPAGTLYVVATPIGNLGDISSRAAKTLGAVDVIAAEDTRVTRKLLDRIGVAAKLVSYRDENERRLAAVLVERLQAGESVALVSDAGTPCISDPGYRLVRAAAEAGIEVVSVPGPSSVLALLSVSGLPTDRFSFEGFPPTKPGARRALLQSLRGGGRTVVFFESPRRALRLLEDIDETLANPSVAVGRELTKMHEEVLRGSAREVASVLRERDGARGEFVIAVALDEATAVEAPNADDLRKEVGRLLEKGLSARDAAEQLREHGVSRQDVYEAARSLGRDRSSK